MSNLKKYTKDEVIEMVVNHSCYYKDDDKLSVDFEYLNSYKTITLPIVINYSNRWYEIPFSTIYNVKVEYCNEDVKSNFNDNGYLECTIVKTLISHERFELINIDDLNLYIVIKVTQEDEACYDPTHIIISEELYNLILRCYKENVKEIIGGL